MIQKYKTKKLRNYGNMRLINVTFKNNKRAPALLESSVCLKQVAPLRTLPVLTFKYYCRHVAFTDRRASWCNKYRSSPLVLSTQSHEAFARLPTTTSRSHYPSNNPSFSLRVPCTTTTQVRKGLSVTLAAGPPTAK